MLIKFQSIDDASEAYYKLTQLVLQSVKEPKQGRSLKAVFPFRFNPTFPYNATYFDRPSLQEEAGIGYDRIAYGESTQMKESPECQAPALAEAASPFMPSKEDSWGMPIASDSVLDHQQADDWLFPVISDSLGVQEFISYEYVNVLRIYLYP